MKKCATDTESEKQVFGKIKLEKEIDWYPQ